MAAEVTELAVDTALDFWAIGQSLAGIVVIGSLVGAGINWKSPTGAAEDLKNEFTNKYGDFPTVCTIGVILGLQTGLINGDYPFLWAVSAGSLSAITRMAAITWSASMIAHYTTRYTRNHGR